MPNQSQWVGLFSVTVKKVKHNQHLISIWGGKENVYPKERLDLGVKITRQIEHPCVAINNNAVTRSTIEFFWKVGFLLNARVQRDLPLFGEKPWLHFRLFYGLGKVIQFYCRKWIWLNGKEIPPQIKAEKMWFWLQRKR